MNMSGEQRIAAPRQRVWEALNDPAVLKRCIPGCQSLEKEADDRLKATVEVKIGPIGARFNGAVTLTDLNPPNGYTIVGEGQGGTVGFAKGGAKVRLADDGAGGTLLSYDVDAQVGGRLAQLGGPIIDATAKQLAGKFFDQFGQVVGAPAAAAEPAPSAGARPAVEPARLPSAAAAPAARPAGGVPIAWVLALVVAGLVGYLLGDAQGGGGSDWMGLATGLLLVVVAAAAFEFGRRTAAPVVMLDPALLKRLVEEAKQ
ncbi:carbon monoxide dehydrogenase subunit G [Phenylobacterium sp. LjRoot219]|uniref:SRPBCC family protein n=1 Tax=Phenylobacterium sp. LjRoot219 TaxID=3342283 RepID=UPI003ED04F5B